MLWVAFYRKKTNPQSPFDFLNLFSAIASHVAKKQNISIGLISSNEDKKFLEAQFTEYQDFIEASVDGKNGAQTKLKAILNYLPEGDALCDMDVLWTSGRPEYEKNCAYALNPEPLIFYKDHSNEQDLIKSCLPMGNVTANAGFLYAPKEIFKEYARRALSLSESTECIGHTYEQMFFVKILQDNNVPLKFIYNHTIHSYKEMKNCYKKTGIRHPFSFKIMPQEAQKFIKIGIKFGDFEFVKELVKTKFPFFKSMIYNKIF
jgi:hypothetical protein